MPATSMSNYLSADRVGNDVLDQVSPEFMLNAWLTNHPKVAKSIHFAGEQYSGDWMTWPDGLKEHLADRWETMVKWYGQSMPSPDPARFPDPLRRDGECDPQWGSGFVVSKEHGRHVYLSHVANGLALEMTGKLPWSIADYSSAHLRDLFSMDYWMAFLAPPDATIGGYVFEELMSPATPAHVMQFFASNDLIGTSARDTIARLFDWCKILIHWTPSDAHAFWGPDAPPIPSSMLIDGSNYTGTNPPTFGRYTMGCGGTSAFMKSVLRAVNIPVENKTPPCGHVMPHFPTVNRTLSHGDDPYDRLGWVTAFPGWPVPELKEYLITIDQWNAWFDPSIDPAVMINNVGKHMGEIAVEYQSDWLLDAYCEDTSAGADHASGQVFAALKTFYTLAELEATQLWDKLAAKTAATNYCSSSVRQPVLPRTQHQVRKPPTDRRLKTSTRRRSRE
jgi:hypothetical protein